MPFVEKEAEEILGLIDCYEIRERVTITSFILENLMVTRRTDKNIKINYLLKKN